MPQPRELTLLARGDYKLIGVKVFADGEWVSEGLLVRGPAKGNHKLKAYFPGDRAQDAHDPFNQVSSESVKPRQP